MSMRALRAGGRGAVRPAVALSLGVVAWEQYLHAATERPTPLHLLLDAALALPIAMIAIVVAVRATPARTFRRACVAAATFTVLLVPSVGIHQLLHRAPALPAALVHALHAPHPSVLSHGAHDATAAFPVAMMICFFALRVRVSIPRRLGTLSVAVASAFSMLPVTILPAHGAPAITPFSVSLPIPPVLTSPDITLNAAEADVSVLPGAPTKMWTYNGTFPGPTIRRPSGVPTRVTVVNNLPPDAGMLTLHHHGEHAASDDDGQPASLMIPNAGSHTYTYDFVEDGAPERGAFQWYHDHAMDVTGRNVWMGLAGMVILDDSAEAAINAALPNGARDVPLMVADRTFDASNQIPYTFNPEGDQGTAILVNGAAQPYMEVADVRYRFRILNASNIRSYDFKLSDGRAFTQVATESGLLPAPVSRTDILLGPAERAEVIVDFSGELGASVTLQNTIGFTPNLSSAMQFRVVRHEDDASSIPATLRAEPSFAFPLPTDTRLWLFGRDLLTGEWTINGKGFDHNRIDATPKLGATERWVFVNTTDVDHIVHIHDVDWHIASRVGGPDPTKIDALLGETGLRESFRLHPNEIVIVVSRFTDHTGVFVFHCHMLEHEDHSMMAQFEVVP